MRRNWSIFILGCVACFSSCKERNSKGPDIRKVKLEIRVDHFEKDFFEMDTNNHHVNQSLKRLKSKYGQFYDDFLYNIAAFSMNDAVTPGEVRKFIAEKRFLYDSAEYYIPHLNRQLKKIENALKRAKIYFPRLSLPSRIITYIGPIDGFGCFYNGEAICVGLQQFLGPNFSGYQSDYLKYLFGTQRMRQFAPSYIAPAAISSWIDKTFPDKLQCLTLEEKLIEEGKKAYLLTKLLPDLPDSLIFGYSKNQMKWCKSNSREIVKYFEKENFFKTKNPEIILSFINDNQRPQNLPSSFPNNIGKYLGYVLINEYIDDLEGINPSVLMNREFQIVNDD